MKFLLDMPVSAKLLDILAEHGHEGVHALQVGLGRATDSELLEVSRREKRILVTADLDFPRLMAIAGHIRPGIILFRGGNYSDQVMCDLLRRVLREVGEEALSTSICVVDKTVIRISRLPVGAKQ